MGNDKTGELFYSFIQYTTYNNTYLNKFKIQYIYKNLILNRR